MFVTLYVKGRGVCEVNFSASILASLYPGAFLQFLIGLMDVSSLCIFTKPFKVGAVGFKFTYFHFSLLCITLWQSFTVFLISLCRFMVMSVFAIVKLLLEIKTSTFMLYSSWYKITIEFPLSALETMALFFINLFLISFMIQSYFFALMSLCAQFIYFFGIVFLCSLQPGGVCSLVRRGVVVSLPSLLPAPGC